MTARRELVPGVPGVSAAVDAPAALRAELEAVRATVDHLGDAGLLHLDASADAAPRS